MLTPPSNTPPTLLSEWSFFSNESLILFLLHIVACMHAQSLSRVQLFVTSQASLSVEFSSQEYWGE